MRPTILLIGCPAYDLLIDNKEFAVYLAPSFFRSAEVPPRNGLAAGGEKAGAGATGALRGAGA